jgi:hypothetical protein
MPTKADDCDVSSPCQVMMRMLVRKYPLGKRNVVTINTLRSAVMPEQRQDIPWAQAPASWPLFHNSNVFITRSSTQRL